MSFLDSFHNARDGGGSKEDESAPPSFDSTPHENEHHPQQHRPNEEYDSEGNVTKVENLEFVPGILGQGSFGTVRLARRRNPAFLYHRSGSNESASSSKSCNAGAIPPSPRGFPSPVSTHRPNRRSASFDETATAPSGEGFGSGSGRYEYLMARARGGLGRFRSKSRDYADGDNNNNNHQNQLVAVKIFSKSNLKRRRTITRDKATKKIQVKTALQQVEREIALMKKLSHPNLVRLFEVIDSPETDSLYMVLEYMPLGEILTFCEQDGTFGRSERWKHKPIQGLLESGRFDEEHAALYIVDILHGLAYLHQHRICHRDLKPENILLSDRGIAKVGDFGVSHIFEEDTSSSESKSRQLQSLTRIEEDQGKVFLPLEHNDEESSISSINSSSPFFLTKHDTESAYAMGRMAGSGILTKTEGTWCFWSPEMCGASNSDSGGFSGYASDMWAVGVCLYIFVTGRLPFYDKVPMDLFDKIAQSDVPYAGLGLSDSLVELLQLCLEKDPNQRAGVGDCLHHAFLQTAREKRIRQLGPEFEISKRAILHISDHDLRTAFRTVTSVPVQVLYSAGKKLQEGLVHTRDNFLGKIPSLASTATMSLGGETESNSSCSKNSTTASSSSSNNNNHSHPKKQSNHVVFYSRQISADSYQSDGGDTNNNHHSYHLALHKHESETDTHVSRLSSGMSLGSRVSFGSNNTDELPMIVSEEIDDDDHHPVENHPPGKPPIKHADSMEASLGEKQIEVSDEVKNGLGQESTAEGGSGCLIQ